jgi:hypothetical protein
MPPIEKTKQGHRKQNGTFVCQGWKVEDCQKKRQINQEGNESGTFEKQMDKPEQAIA